MAARAHEYDELKLRFERGEGERCRVLASAPGGEAAGSFELPFSELELENFILRLGRSPMGRRRMESSEMSEARRFGGRLFEALFQARVRDLYHGALARAEGRGRGLRITLHLTDVPELLHLPWEYLYDEPDFLAISTWTPVVRYLDLPRQRGPLELQLPLRILAMVSSPSDFATLDVAHERANLETALGPLIAAGAVELCWLEQATLRALLRELRKGDFHIFHYIGHGQYDQQAEDGVLLLEGENERGRAVSGRELGTILHDCTSLRLAVLNACEGARSARTDPFAGVAASLVQCEIPAVIAMQFEITDAAAVVFSEGFYEALAAGFPVDAALAEARKAIFAEHNDTEWGTPVLFMRVPDGRIFDIPDPPQLPSEEAVTAPRPEPDDPPVTPVGSPLLPLERIAGLVAPASAALLFLAPFLHWHLHTEEDPVIGWDAAKQSWLMAFLAITVLVLAFARRSGRLPKTVGATAVFASALAALFVDEAVVMRGPGGIGPGRELAMYASVGIVLSGWITLAVMGGSGPRRGDLIAALGAIVVVGTLFLDYRQNEAGWSFFGHQQTVFVTLLGVVLLAALGRLTPAGLGSSWAGGALLALVGLVVVQRVGYPYNMRNAVWMRPNLRIPGYWAALGGALIIVAGGLLACFDGRSLDAADQTAAGVNP